MHQMALDQLVTQHTAELRADATHHRLVRRLRDQKHARRPAPITQWLDGPVDCAVVADRRSTSGAAPDRVRWLPSWPRMPRSPRSITPPSALAHRMITVVVSVLLFLALAAAATVQRHNPGHTPVPAPTGTLPGHGAGRAMVG